MGAFKFRGAYNAIAQFTPEQGAAGVVAFSSGNHAQSIALAARLLGVQTLIVMPQDAPQIKVTATRGYGGELDVLVVPLAGRMKMVVEPTGCLGAAAVIGQQVAVRGKRVGILISGGNVDLARFAALSHG